MGKLRMKETSQERAERERKEAKELRKKQKKMKKKRRKGHKPRTELTTSESEEDRQSRPSKYYKEFSSDESDSEDAARHPRKQHRSSLRKGKERSRDQDGDGKQDGSPDIDSDSYVPPRPSKDRPYVPYTFDDEDEESRLPPPQSEKRDRAYDQESFNERLFEAMREDEGFDPFSSSARSAGMSYDYREHTAINDSYSDATYGLNGVKSDRYVDPDTGVILNRVIFKDAMNDEEYAEHIRRGMFRRTRKEELARQEELERLQKEKEKKRAEEIARTRALEAERIRKLEDKARRTARQGTIKSREGYQLAWARLVDPKRQTEELKMDDFPWPISQENGGVLDKRSVQDYLLSHLDNDESASEADLAKRRKQAIRTAVLAYHPDRFERYVLRVKEQGGQRESVRQMGLRVSQILNEIMQDI